MIKTIVYTALLILLQSFAFSQTDTLITVDGNAVPVVISEITRSEILYKMPNKIDMPLLHYSRNNLVLIILKDGSRINPRYKGVNPFTKDEVKNGKTVLLFSPSQLFINQVGLSVERIFKGHYFGIRVPISFAYSNPYTIGDVGAHAIEYDNKRFWSTGIDLNIYPFNLGGFKYMVGAGFQVAQFGYQAQHQYPNNNVYPHNNYYYDYYYTNERGMHYSFVINNGFVSRIGKHFFMSSSFGFGLQKDLAVGARNYHSGYNYIRINLSANVGYMF